MFAEVFSYDNELRHAGWQEGNLAGKLEGKAEGKIEGKLEGKIEEKTEIALSGLKNGLSVEVIALITGLSEEAVLTLQKEHGL